MNMHFQRVALVAVALGSTACSPTAALPRARASAVPTGSADEPPPARVAAAVEAHNARRAEAKLPPLVAEPKLTAAAADHAKEMAHLGKMTHDGADGSTAAQRVERAGYRYRATGENVAYGQKSVEEVMDAWMNSPGHKRNILGDFTQVGVGIAPAADGTLYWCVDFGRPLGTADPADGPASLLKACNDARALKDLPPFAADPLLAKAAARHSKEAADRGEFAPKDIDGKSPFERARELSPKVGAMGMAEAWGEPEAAKVVDAWRDQEGLKEQLFGTFDRVGIAVATTKAGVPYWTVIFGATAGR